MQHAHSVRLFDIIVGFTQGVQTRKALQKVSEVRGIEALGGINAVTLGVSVGRVDCADKIPMPLQATHKT
jgi:hypothetical protein